MVTFKAAGSIFGFGILVLVIGLFVGPMVGATQTGATQSVSLSDGESQQIQQNIDVELSLDANNNATVTVVDTTTYNQNTTESLSEGETTTLTVSGEEIGVTYDLVTAAYAVLSFDYPSTFGFEENSRVFYDNLGLLLSIVGMLFAMTGVVMGVRAA